MNKPVQLAKLYANRIQSLHDTKLIENKKKLDCRGGAINIDDHGYIHFEGFHFEPVYPAGENILHGSRCIGENLRKFLNEIPTYIHPDSALASAWAGIFQDMFARVGLCEQDRPAHLYGLWEKYGITQSGVGGMNHMSPDMNIGLKLGYSGLLEKIRECRSSLKPADTDFFDGEEELVLGIIEFIKRHSDYAGKLASYEVDIEKKNNFIAIADSLDAIAMREPRTFREACQFLAIFQSVDRTYFGGGALGQLDELLLPYFERDIKAGILTEEEAVWILASLFYNDTHYSQVGGQTPDGSRDITSRVSFLILQAAHELHIPYNLAVRVFEGSDDMLLKRAVEYVLEDGSGPAFSLSKGIEEGFCKQGHPRELARMRAKVGCNWVALPGIEYPLQDVTRLNMALPLLYAMDELADCDSITMEQLWEHFSEHLAVAVNCIKEGYDWHYEVVSRNTPEIVLNLFCHGPIERGLNAACGGVDILNLNCDGIALATVADSFAAIEQRVINEGKLTWKELYNAVKANFESAEDIRLMLNSIPRFGNPDSLAQQWAERISTTYTDMVVSTKTPKHHLAVIPGMFSHGDVFAYGKSLPATPNGRRYGDPISHSSEPDPGFATGLTSFSPTLKANAVALVQPGYGNSAPLHLDVDKDMLSRAGGIDALCGLIRGHEQMGGTLLNLNCISRERIIRAHEDPSLEPDLVVRVTGYSAFFASLSREYRQQVVDRYLTDKAL